MATTSVGNLTINSTDTSVNPLVNVNWLATQTDQEVAVQAFKRARQVGAATGITVGPEYSPGPSVQTDAQILNFIRSTLSPIHHATGTCKPFFISHEQVDVHNMYFAEPFCPLCLPSPRSTELFSLTCLFLQAPSAILATLMPLSTRMDACTASIVSAWSTLRPSRCAPQAISRPQCVSPALQRFGSKRGMLT